MDARCFLGCVLHELGDLEGALHELTTAVAMDPNDADAHCMIANMLYEKGDLKGALVQP